MPLFVHKIIKVHIELTFVANFPFLYKGSKILTTISAASFRVTGWSVTWPPSPSASTFLSCTTGSKVTLRLLSGGRLHLAWGWERDSPSSRGFTMRSVYRMWDTNAENFCFSHTIKLQCFVKKNTLSPKIDKSNEHWRPQCNVFLSKTALYQAR